MNDDSGRFGDRTAEVERILRAFAEFADCLVTDFVLADLLDRVVGEAIALLPVDSAAILVNGEQAVDLATASDEGVLRLAEFELTAGSGPGLDAVQDQHVQAIPDVAVLEQTWPAYAADFVVAGYKAVHAFRMRDRNKAIGALILLCRFRTPWSDCDLQIGQALADLAAVAVVLRRRANAAGLAVQLQQALDSRIVVGAVGSAARSSGIRRVSGS